ncbi:MAG: hypothetical protein ABI051_01500 [Vicinamibacterales bacterium]
MTSHALFVTVLLLLLVPQRSEAQQDRRIFSRDTLLRSVAAAEGHQLRDPRTDWDRVRRLKPATAIIVSANTIGVRRCRLESADDSGIVVVDLEAAARPTIRVLRTDITRVERLAGRQGSVAGAIAGGGGGFALGLYTATLLAYKDCGGGCSDEQFLMTVSLVGLPIAGAVLGYHLSGGTRRLEVIYVAP